MQRIKLLKAFFIAVLVVVIPFTLSAQESTLTPSGEITLGETIDVQTPAAYTLTVDKIMPVTIVARSLDASTNPSFTLLNPSGETIFTVEVNATYRSDMGPKDVGIQNMMLTPGTYTLELNNAEQDDGRVQGDGRISISVLEGTQGVLGAGYTEIIEAEITAENLIYGHELHLTEGEVITIATRAITSRMIEGEANANDAGLDTSMLLYAPDGSVIGANDDHDSESLVLDFGDSQLARWVVPTTGTYRVVVSDLEGTHAGIFWLIATRHGMLEPSGVEPEVYTGQILAGGRRTFLFEAEENELITVIARATNSTLDTVLTLYNPDGLPVFENDDHSLIDPTIGQFDSVIDNYLIIVPGQYEIDLQTYDEGGSYEVTFIRLGIVQPTEDTTPIFGERVEVAAP
jgi:hypothetical protein